MEEHSGTQGPSNGDEPYTRSGNRNPTSGILDLQRRDSGLREEVYKALTESSNELVSAELPSIKSENNWRIPATDSPSVFRARNDETTVSTTGQGSPTRSREKFNLLELQQQQGKAEHLNKIQELCMGVQVEGLIPENPKHKG